MDHKSQSYIYIIAMKIGSDAITDNQGLIRPSYRLEKAVDARPVSIKIARLAQIEFFLAVATVFFAPMNFLRHPAVFITLGDVFAGLCLLTMLLSRTVPLRPLGPGTSMWMLGATLLIGGLLVSSLFNGDALRGGVVSLQYFYSLFVLPLVIAGRPLPQVVALIKVFVFSIVLMSLFGIYLIHIDGETNTRFVSGSGRMLSFVERENECASLIALTIPLVIWLRATGRISLPIIWFTLPVMAYGILLTGSNTGLFAIMGAFAIHFVGNLSWRQLVTGVGSAVAIVYAITSWGRDFLPEVFQKRVLGALESADIEQAGTFAGRMELIVESLGMANNALLLGVGADQYRLISYWNQPVHNAYLLIWTEGGLLALVGYLLVLLSGLYVAGILLQHARDKAAALCTLSTFLIFALTTNAVAHIYARFWYTPLLLAVAVGMGALRAACFGQGPLSETMAAAGFAVGAQAARGSRK